MKTLFETVGKLTVLVALLFMVYGVGQRVSLEFNRESPKEVEARWIREDREQKEKQRQFAEIIAPICKKYGGKFVQREGHLLGDKGVMGKLLSEDSCFKDGHEYLFEKRNYGEGGGVWARIQELNECAIDQAYKEYEASPKYKEDLEKQKNLPKGTIMLNIIRDGTDEQIKRGCFNK